jgi:hypothetical protein
LNLVSSALNMAEPAVFSGNGAGNIFPASPTLCSFPLSSGAAGVSSLASITGTSGLANISLSSFLANTPMGVSQGIFIGKYNYVHTLAGLQIISLDPAFQQVAMTGS